MPGKTRLNDADLTLTHWSCVAIISLFPGCYCHLQCLLAVSSLCAIFSSSGFCPFSGLFCVCSQVSLQSDTCLLLHGTRTSTFHVGVSPALWTGLGTQGMSEWDSKLILGHGDFKRAWTLKSDRFSLGFFSVNVPLSFYLSSKFLKSLLAPFHLSQFTFK